MIKCKGLFSLAITFALLLSVSVSSARAGDYQIIQLTDNSTDDSFPVMNNRGQIAWLTNIYANRLWPRHRLSFYDGGQPFFLTDESGKKVYWQSINDNGQISFVEYNPFTFDDPTIALIDGHERIISGVPGEISPLYGNHRETLNNNFLLWNSKSGEDCVSGSCRYFHLYNIHSGKNIDLDFAEDMDWLDIDNDGQAVWSAQGKVLFFDGADTRSLGPGDYPSINNNNQILWLNTDDNKYRLFNSTTNLEITTNISGDDTHGLLFRFNDLGQVAWSGQDPVTGDLAIYLSDVINTTIIPVPSPIDLDSFHLNNKGQIAWLDYDPVDPGAEKHAFVYDGSTIVMLDMGSLATQIYSMDFNDQGDVVLSASDGNDAEIFLAKTQSAPLDLANVVIADLAGLGSIVQQTGP